MGETGRKKSQPDPVGTHVTDTNRAQLNILDLVPIAEGGTAADAIEQTVDLAQHAEQWGYGRYWMAEHHNFRGVASSSTAVLIGHVASHTRTIRVGAGGIMLPNHAPYVVAEQFAPWRRCIRVGSTSASAAPPAPTRRPREPCAGTKWRQ